MFRDKNRKLWTASLGAGILGAVVLAMRYGRRPQPKHFMPDAISPAIFATKVLHTSAGEIVYHEAGRGQPLIFVHGVSVGASSYEWSKVYAAFAQDFRVLALDLVGFGESARPKAALTETDYARSLAEFCRAVSGDAFPILIGSGLGGGFCAHVASQHPELVSRLILLMPTGLRDFGRQRLPLRSKILSRIPVLSGIFYRNLSTHAAVRAWLSEVGFADPARVSEEVVDVFATCAQQYGAEHALLNFQAGRMNFDLASRMRGLTQPVTLLWTDQPSFPPLEWGYQLQRGVRNSQLVILEGVGPLAALEDPAQVTSVLREQLDRDLRVYKAS